MSRWMKDAESKEGGDAKGTGALDSTNIGFRLLQKAGWKGGGLGKTESGIKSPVPASTQKGRRGIGSAPPEPKKREKTDRAPRVEASQSAADEDERRKRRAQQKEDARKRQRRDEAIAVGLRREFAATSAEEAGHNPLLKRTPKNRRRNPLLDD